MSVLAWTPVSLSMWRYSSVCQLKGHLFEPNLARHANYQHAVQHRWCQCDPECLCNGLIVKDRGPLDKYLTVVLVRSVHKLIYVNKLFQEAKGSFQLKSHMCRKWCVAIGSKFWCWLWYPVIVSEWRYYRFLRRLCGPLVILSLILKT